MESLNSTGASPQPTSKIISNSPDSCKASVARKKRKPKKRKSLKAKVKQGFVPNIAKDTNGFLKPKESWVQQRIASLEKNRIRLFKRTCVFNLKGKCTRDCSYAHIGRPKRLERCKFFMMDSCAAGENCYYSHNVPCKYHQVYNTCKQDNCKFSHDIMSYEERMRFLKDFKCELPPSEIHHDLNQLVPKNSQNPLLRPDADAESKDPFLKNNRSLQVLEPEVPTAMEITANSDSEETKSIEETPLIEPQAEKPLKPIRGFYKDTLSDDEEEVSAESPQMPNLEEPIQLVQSPNDPEAEAVRKIEEEIRMDAENMENLDPEMETFGFDAGVPVGMDDPECPCINGVPDDGIEWKLQKAFAAFPDYSDLRPQYLISLSVIDPRLAPVNRKLPPKEFSEEENHRNRENDFTKSLSLSSLFGKGKGARRNQTENDYPEDHRRISNAELAEMYAEDDTPASPVQVDNERGDENGDADLDLDDLDPCSGPG